VSSFPETKLIKKPTHSLTNIELETI